MRVGLVGPLIVVGDDNNVGVYALGEGDLDVARRHLEQSARAARTIGVVGHHTSVNLGWVSREEGDHRSAWALFDEGLRLSRRQRDRVGIAYAVLGLACLAADAGKWQQALLLHGIAQLFTDQRGAPWQFPEELYRLASLELVRANVSESEYSDAAAEAASLRLDEAIEMAMEIVSTRTG